MTKSDGQDLSRLAEAFAQGYRRARKYQGSFGIVLQSMNDLTLFGGTGQVILENAATRFLLQGSTYDRAVERSEEHTSELQSLMRISYAVFCLKKKITNNKLVNT